MHDARFVKITSMTCNNAEDTVSSKSRNIYIPPFSQDGKTAVHHAVLGDPPKAEPSYEAVKFLLENGGEPNTADDVSGSFSGIHVYVSC